MAFKVNICGEYSNSMPGKFRTKTIQNLILLGILADGPLHGYEVRKAIDEKLGPLVGVKSCSVYYSLDKLEKEGFLSSRSARSGNRPKKFVYKLTGKGRRELKKLLVRNLLMVERPFMNLDLSLYFLKHIDKALFEKALTKRVGFLQSVSRNYLGPVTQKPESELEESIRNVEEHDLGILKEEIRFTKKLLAELHQTAQKK